MIVILSDNIGVASEVILKKLPNLILKRVKAIPNPFEAGNK